MAENLYRALWSWLVCVFVTVVVSYLTEPKTTAELNGLVYGATVIPHEEPVPIYKHYLFWTVIVIVIFFALNIIFF